MVHQPSLSRYDGPQCHLITSYVLSNSINLSHDRRDNVSRFAYPGRDEACLGSVLALVSKKAQAVHQCSPVICFVLLTTKVLICLEFCSYRIRDELYPSVDN